MSAAEVARELCRFRFRYANEAEIQEALAAALSTSGIPTRREVRLSARDRVDLLTGDGVVVEVKVAGRTADVLRQITRYAAHDEVTGIVVVTNRASHVFPSLIAGKPVEIVSLVLGSFGGL